MPPRTAYSPVSRTVPVRRKPLISSQATSASVATMLPGAAEKRLLRHAAARDHALHDRVDRRRQDARVRLGRARAGEPRQRRHALRRDAGVRRHAVVGLAVPGRESQDLDLGRDELQRVLERLLPEAVAGDVDQHRRPIRRAGERPREVGDDEHVEAVRHARQRRLVAARKGVEGTGERRGHMGPGFIRCHRSCTVIPGLAKREPGTHEQAPKLAPT